VLAVFALTTRATVATSWAALAALLGTLCKMPSARSAVLACVALFGVLNIRAKLATGVPPSGPSPGQAPAGTSERFVVAHGASVGYGGYWDSAPVMWETHLRVRLYPIDQCDTPVRWCPFGGRRINTWYVPRPHTRTFLLTDTRPGTPLEVSSPPASFGHPIAEEALEGGLTLYIYDHDIAANLDS
jgi:hypothetical protein